jgi:hypothetical protein
MPIVNPNPVVVPPTAEITIWDYTKFPRTITVERFLEIMVGYGMYCYAQRV